MSRLLAHAITGRETGGPAAGLRGLPLRWIGGGDLGVWATTWSGEPTLTRDDAFAHHDLVAVLCEAGPCVPVRFGTWLETEDAARRALEAGEARFAAAADRLAGRQEIAVTLLWTDLAPAAARPGRSMPAPAASGSVAPARIAAASPGRSFLERRRATHAETDEHRRVAEGLARRLGSALATDQADVRHETCPSGEVALSLSLLVRSQEAAALKARATAAVAALPGVRGVVSGPWPPYSFTEDLARPSRAGARGGS